MGPSCGPSAPPGRRLDDKIMRQHEYLDGQVSADTLLARLLEAWLEEWTSIRDRHLSIVFIWKQPVAVDAKTGDLSPLKKTIDGRWIHAKLVCHFPNGHYGRRNTSLHGRLFLHRQSSQSRRFSN